MDITDVEILHDYVVRLRRCRQRRTGPAQPFVTNL